MGRGGVSAMAISGHTDIYPRVDRLQVEEGKQRVGRRVVHSNMFQTSVQLVLILEPFKQNWSSAGNYVARQDIGGILK